MEQFEAARFCTPLSLECEHCGKSFQRTKKVIHRGRKVHYCSCECSKAHRNAGKTVSSTDVKCDVCDKVFQRRNTMLILRALHERKSHCCSKACAGKLLGSSLRGVRLSMSEDKMKALCAEVLANPRVWRSKLAAKYKVSTGTISNVLKHHGISLASRRNEYVFPGWRFNSIKQVAIKNKHVFTVSQQYLHDLFHQQGGRCVYTGWTLTFDRTRDGHRTGTASLDRIDSSKGYVEGNVQWVNKHINLMKLWRAHGDFIEFCKAVARHHGTMESTPEEIDRISKHMSLNTRKWKQDRIEVFDALKASEAIVEPPKSLTA